MALYINGEKVSVVLSTIVSPTITNPTINGTVVTTGLTLPAFALGGSTGITFSGSYFAFMNVDNAALSFGGGSASGGKGGYITLGGKDWGPGAGVIWLQTPNAAGDADVNRLQISGNSAAGAGSIYSTEQIRIGASSTNNAIWTASQGAASTAFYIGNAQITVASDVRVKNNIALYQGDATGLIRKLNVVQFDYLENYRPFGGVYSDKYVGLTAQELFKFAPWTVNTQGGKNCPKCLNGQPCSKHNPWQVNHELLTGVVVKSIQELDERLARLES